MIKIIFLCIIIPVVIIPLITIFLASNYKVNKLRSSGKFYLGSYTKIQYTFIQLIAFLWARVFGLKIKYKISSKIINGNNRYEIHVKDGFFIWRDIKYTNYTPFSSYYNALDFLKNLLAYEAINNSKIYGFATGNIIAVEKFNLGRR